MSSFQFPTRTEGLYVRTLICAEFCFTLVAVATDVVFYFLARKMSASRKPPLSVGKARAGATVQKLTKIALPTTKHKVTHRSSSVSELDQSSYCSRRSSISDSRPCKNIEVASSNTAMVNRMEREIDVSFCTWHCKLLGKLVI